MKRVFIAIGAFVLLTLSNLNVSAESGMNAQGEMSPENVGVTKQTVDSALIFYNGGEYDKCISLATSHEKDLRISEKDYYYLLLGYASLSITAKRNSYQEITEDERRNRITWAMTCCHALYLWIKDKSKDKIYSVDEINDYFTRIELVTLCSSSISDDMEKITKRFDKISDKCIKQAYNLTFENRSTWANYPVTQLMILDNAIEYYVLKKKCLSDIPSFIIDEYWDAIDDLVELTESENNNNLLSVSANIYVGKLKEKFQSDILFKKTNPSLALDVLLKSRDFMLYAKGAKQYRNFKNTSWKNIQHSLKDCEYCMEHFESHTAKGMFYALWDSNTRRRNYAYIFNNKSTKPETWHRGYIDNIEKQGFSRVIEAYPDCKTVYSTGTDYMLLKDIVGTDIRVHRVHSLSNIAEVSDSIGLYNFAFIGRIDYSKDVNNERKTNANVKGAVRSSSYYGFKTDDTLLDCLSKLNIPTFQTLMRGNVTHDKLQDVLKQYRIVHISTHGIYDEATLSAMNDQTDLNVINGTNIFKNCKLILSGYNQNKSCCISGEEIRRMDLSNIDLLFLDACQTAAGKQIGLGSFSLAEAFHYAGVKNIIATLDPVDSSVTCDFAMKFYGYLANGQSVHQAFYTAKIEVCPDVRLILWE